MSKHLADHQRPTAGGRMKHFLRLARVARETWHRPHSEPGTTRLVQFLRIARGRSV